MLPFAQKVGYQPAREAVLRRLGNMRWPQSRANYMFLKTISERGRHINQLAQPVLNALRSASD